MYRRTTRSNHSSAESEVPPAASTPIRVLSTGESDDDSPPAIRVQASSSVEHMQPSDISSYGYNPLVGTPSSRPACPPGTTLRPLVQGRLVSTLPPFDHRSVKSAMRLESSTFDGDVKKVESFVMNKHQICSEPAELLVLLVLSFRGSARDWWEHHPYNYDGSQESLDSFLRALRAAYKEAGAKKLAHRQLGELSLELSPGAWTIFRTKLTELLYFLSIPDEYAVTLLLDKLLTASPCASRYRDGIQHCC